MLNTPREGRWAKDRDENLPNPSLAGLEEVGDTQGQVRSAGDRTRPRQTNFKAQPESTETTVPPHKGGKWGRNAKQGQRKNREEMEMNGKNKLAASRVLFHTPAFVQLWPFDTIFTPPLGGSDSPPAIISLLPAGQHLAFLQ